MNTKLYDKEYPDDEEIPLNGNHHTIDYYKKSISYFMPNRDVVWNAMLKSGNPTRSVAVNGLLKKVRDLHVEAGGTKKRKASTASTEKPSTAPPTTPVAAKKARASLPAVVAANPSVRVATATPKEGSAGMHAILRRMHDQNASFIDLFSTLSQSLQTFTTTLQANNKAIMTEIANLSSTSMNALPDQAVPGVGAEGTEPTQPGVALGPSLEADTHDWEYLHADGKPTPVTLLFLLACSDNLFCRSRQVFGGEFPQLGPFLIAACKKCTTCGIAEIDKIISLP
jgi:hypothetical protein